MSKQGVRRLQQTGRIEGGFIRSSQRATMLYCLLWLILMATNTSVWAAENLSLSASTSISNEGYFVLDWQTDSPVEGLTLEQANNQSFDNPLERDLAGASAATITGLDNGTYYFRLTDTNSPLSNTVSVTVEHHSLVRAGGFFLLGLALFSILIVTILKGNRQAGI